MTTTCKHKWITTHQVWTPPKSRPRQVQAQIGRACPHCSTVEVGEVLAFAPATKDNTKSGFIKSVLTELLHGLE